MCEKLVYDGKLGVVQAILNNRCSGCDIYMYVRKTWLMVSPTFVNNTLLIASVLMHIQVMFYVFIHRHSIGGYKLKYGVESFCELAQFDWL